MSEFMQIPPTYAVADPQVRAVLDALTRNVQITIDSIQAQTTAVATTAPGGVTTFGSPGDITNVTNLGAAYTPQNLKDDLATGTVNVIAGATNGTTIMKLGTAGEYVVFQHKNAVMLGSTGAYTGTVRTGLGITSTGIVGGYNRQSDGAWQSTFTIESATGNLTVLGTIKANSVIQVGAYLGTQTVSTVLSNISTASSDASTALTEVTNKLNKNASDILSGSITFSSAGGFKTGTIAIDGSGNVTGAGVAFTSKGIVGRNASNTTFTIDATTGAATFGGRVETADYVSANGISYVAGNVLFASNGLTYTVAGSIVGTTTATSTSGQVRCGTYGIMGGVYNANSFNVGAIGIASSSFANSFGMYGQGYVGVYGATNSAGAGVQAVNTGAGPSLACSSSFAWGGYTYSAPDGGTDKYLRNDGSWAPVAALGGGTVSSVAMSVPTGLAISGSPITTTGTLAVTWSGTIPTAQIPNHDASKITSGTFTPARLGSGASGVLYFDGTSCAYNNGVLNQANTNSGTATASGLAMSFLGATSTGVAGAYVGTSGSGSTVTWTVQTTSPSDRRLKEDIENCDLGLAFVDSLVPKKYRLKADERHQLAYGFIADEVAALGVYGSSLVYHEENWRVGDVVGFDTIHYPSYVAVLTKAIQELSAKVTQLENINARSSHSSKDTH